VATFPASAGDRTKFKYNVVPMPSITAANGKQVIPTGGGSLGWCLAPADAQRARAGVLEVPVLPAGQVVAERPSVSCRPRRRTTAPWPSGGPSRADRQQLCVRHRRRHGDDRPTDSGTVFTLSNTDIPAAVTAATTGHESIAKAFTNLQNQMLYAYTLNG